MRQNLIDATKDDDSISSFELYNFTWAKANTEMYNGLIKMIFVVSNPLLISILVIFDLNSNKMIYTIHQGLICPQYPQKAFISNPNMDI